MTLLTSTQFESLDSLQVVLQMFLIHLKAAAVMVDREHVLRGDLVILISKKEEWMKPKY